jgi:hypothetical protein
VCSFSLIWYICHPLEFVVSENLAAIRVGRPNDDIFALRQFMRSFARRGATRFSGSKTFDFGGLLAKFVIGPMPTGQIQIMVWNALKVTCGGSRNKTMYVSSL